MPGPDPDRAKSTADYARLRGTGRSNVAVRCLPHDQPTEQSESISTHSFSAAHFATFPPKLVEPCIKAGTSERGACASCGAPWRRVESSEASGGTIGASWHDALRGDDLGRGQSQSESRPGTEATTARLTGCTASHLTGALMTSDRQGCSGTVHHVALRRARPVRRRWDCGTRGRPAAARRRADRDQRRIRERWPARASRPTLRLLAQVEVRGRDRATTCRRMDLLTS